MNKVVLGGGMLVVALIAAGPVWAESPMSPVKRLSPGAAPGASKQWVEPPAADKPDTASSTAADAANAAEKPQANQAEDNRRSRSAQRAAARSVSTASRLNRQELSRLRSGGGYYSGYYSGYGYYGQPAYSNSGD